jgi:hypothetical protein
MDAADGRNPKRFQELAVAAAKEKAGLVRKRIGDEKADVTCRYDPSNKSYYSMLFSLWLSGTWALK